VVRALVHLVPRAGAAERFHARVAALLAELRERATPRGIAVHGLSRLERDAFGKHTPFRAGIELLGPDAGAEPLADVIGELGAQLDDVAHPDASTLLVGSDVVFVAGPRTPVRYQYLMRRNAAHSHESYLDYYRTKHSRFGIETPGKPGYVQLHVDRDASRRAAARAGLGIWGFDSVSELHLESLEGFLDALATSGFGTEPIADEELFVDRARSLDLCSAVDWGA
jgi:EthD domain-containing protein